MNMEIRTEAMQFPEKEKINGIFLAVQWLGTGEWELVTGYTGDWRPAIGTCDWRPVI
jgi:hypothetical protein